MQNRKNRSSAWNKGLSNEETLRNAKEYSEVQKIGSLPGNKVCQIQTHREM